MARQLSDAVPKAERKEKRKGARDKAPMERKDGGAGDKVASKPPITRSERESEVVASLVMRLENPTNSLFFLSPCSCACQFFPVTCPF